MADRLSNKHLLNNPMHMRERMDWLDRLFPLPPAPPDQCRDEYLRELLQPRESHTHGSGRFVESSSDDSILPRRIRFGTDIKSTEARIVDEFVRTRSVIIPNRQTMLPRRTIMQDDKFNPSVLNKMLRDRYGSIAKAIGCVAVLFQMTELKNQMAVVREMWRHKTNADNSLKMFSWSIKDYFMRLKMRDTVYLDTIELELKSQMDCFKFRMDLKEIIRLVDAVYDDFKAKRDMCNRSMLLIKDAQGDIMELLSNSLREAEAQHNQLTKDMQENPRLANPGRQAKIYYMDFMVPIETRYKINWAQAIMEQSIFYDDLCEKYWRLSYA
ncbi:uncharacterized protein [Drosophila virilis]|uniref:Uncharacterized protein, isoform B n=1 Tax=Drosophila virilis TaxID=7244 RepID=A0A0Q9WA26_DROVI|nr:uncharacterized protein LOC6628829 isoform X2 [Drosophila virilis]KRF81514.1 uncharacterized protein Dvir_GJ17346, isoform B [Drosophila virilis]